MSTRKSIQKVNTTESPTKTTVTMSSATVSSPQTTTTSITPILELDSKVLDNNDAVVTKDNNTTTTSTPTELTNTITTSTTSITTTPTTATTTITTTTVDSIPKTVTAATATAENDLIKTSDSEIMDTTITTNASLSNISVPTKEPQISPIISNTDLTITTPTLDIKRGRRKNSAATSITSSPTCSQQSNKKSSVGSSAAGDDINDELTTPLIGVDDWITENINELVDDKKLTQQQNSCEGEQQQKLIEQNKSESPVRVGRKKKVFDKTAIITRKSAATTPTTTKQPVVKPPINVRTSKRNRRNSTGKIDSKQNEPKKSGKQTRKTLSSTPEPRTPIKRKREDSVKSDDKDEHQHIDKMIKIEVDDEHQQEQMDINEDDSKLDEDEMKNDEKDSVMEDQIDDEALSTTKVDETLLNIKSELKKSNDELNNSDKKYLAYPRPRRGRPKNSTNNTKTNIRRSRSERTPIDTSLALPVIKRPRRRGKQIDEKTFEKDDNSILDDTVLDDTANKNDLEITTCIGVGDNNDDTNLNSLEKPLTVDTTTLPNENEKSKLNIIDTIKNEVATTSSDKAASLSPELISEGVSVISVKQFYKKPEFLENNLGIEKDPKLGEIVQEVEKNTSSNTPTLNTNDTKNINQIQEEEKLIENDLDEIESESLIEGELHIDEEEYNEDESNNKNIIKKTNEINKDDNNDIIIDNNLTNENIKKNIKIKDSNKENNSSDMLKLNLCDKNHNNENSTAVQIESNNIIIINDDNNIKDKIQSECNNKKTINAGETKKDLKNNNDSKKKILNINENIKVTETNQILDKDQLVKVEINSELIDITKNNTDEKIKKPKDLLVDEIKVEENMEVDEEENTTKIFEGNVEKNEEINDNLSSKTMDSKNNESDGSTISNHSKSETIDETNTKSSTEQNKKLSSSTNKRLLETPETMRQKEKHLKNLGLLTHKAAVQAKIEKQRRRKLLQNTASTNKKQAAETSSSSLNISTIMPGNTSTTGNVSKIQDAPATSTTSTVYSIKSGENKRKSANGSGSNTNNNGRQSLKITFQKGRGRGIQNERSGTQSNQSGEDIYYTIQNENEGGQSEEAVTHGRKSLNRNHTIDTSNQLDTTIDLQNKKDGKEKILIPEKASSFSIHPGRLCQDQCYYCGGRFGLYDTPCHVAQLKSAERQQKILANEEKLTIDNCLCDACFRHVDKRANVPSYKKRLTALISVENDNSNNSQQQSDNENTADEQQLQIQPQEQHQTSFGNRSICFVPGCNNSAAHSLRKKCIRKTIKKILPNFDMSTIGGITPICSQHYDSILQYLGCALCKRRLGKNHMYHIQESEKLEVLLSENNVPVQIGNSSAICKLCRYFTNLLMKPSTGTKQDEFVRSYRRRLLQFHNIHNVQSDDDVSDEGNGGDSEKLKSKRNRKAKRESTIIDDKNSESTNSPPALVIDENPSASSSPATLATSATSGQMMLDNDVLVDYDVPIISSDSPTPSPPPLLASKLKSILQSNNNISNNNNNDKNTDITLINNNKKEDISLVLRSNPNISMRELFPGEEEMGLHVNLPFGSSLSHRTPEGWTRVQTFLQYDEPTRRLWEDLQKPYGNQSSFLRHLILLEKYYRNGDLILSNNASSNASVYSETVQNRLRSYDNNNLNNNHIASNSTITVTPILNTAGGGGSLQQQTTHRKNLINKNESSRSQSVEKQINNNNNNNYPVTITTRPKQNPQSSTSTNINNNNNNNNKNQCSTSNNNLSNDLMKTNLIVGNKNAIEILPILSSLSSTKTTDSNLSTSGLMTKQQKLLAAANKLIGNETAIDLKTIPSTTTATITNKNINDQKKNDINSNINLSMPPELISINRQSSGMMIGKQQQQTQQQRDQQQQQLQLQQQHQRIQNFQQQLPQHHNKHNSSKHGIIVLPESLTPMETLNMKNWRPTLMPITSGAHLNQSGPLYKTVDGRKLPAVVQVQSRGRPYLISIHDYNRMCILRREKLLYDQMVKNGKIKHGMRPPTHLSPKILSSHQQQQQQQNKLKIPNKILEQNSLIPVGGAQRSTTTTTNSLQQQISHESRQIKLRQQQQQQQQQQHQQQQHQQQQHQQHQQQQQHQHQLQQQHHQQQISLLKSSTSGGNFVPILPKSTQNYQLQILPTTSNHTPMSIATSLVNNSVSIVPTISGVLSLAHGTTIGNHTLTSLTPSAIAAGLHSSGVSMRNIMAAQKPRVNQLISQNYQKTNINSNNNNRNNIGGSNLIGTSTSSVMLDNSLLSKIPKSLTVIPQQKLQSHQQQGRTSAEDLTSA